MESLGVLAGGIAHDFNNLLGGVFGNIDLALDSLDDRTEITKFLNRSISAIERAKDLTQQLLTFSKGGIPKKRTIELAPLLKESRDLSLSGSAIECKMKIEDRLHPVNADANQMSQVFNNVLINARQAMPNGGEVTINANNQTLTDNEIASLPGGEYVKIDIQDHGEGIPPSSMSKIFDPFFTTKETGSGLGLATCYSIIKKHDGLILVDSTLGKGTHVNIYLPSSKLATTSLSIHAPTPTKRGKGRILLMDDEELILEVAEAMLQRLGYNVVSTRNGDEAIRIYTEALSQGNRFGVVLFDLTVPGGAGGDKAIAEILKIDPNAVGIVSSGYADSPVLSDPIRYGFKGHIEKPFRKERLKKVLNDVLHI